MVKENLTETVIKKVEHKPKQFKLSDGGGLYLLIHPNGSKYWRFDFRFNGKQKSSSLGVWPEVSLIQARTIRNSAKKKIKAGINPIEERRNQKQFQKSNNDFELRGTKSGETKYDETLKGTGTTIASSSSLRENSQTVFNEIILNVFPKFGEEKFSELEKEDLFKILKNIIENRKKLFSIFWRIYPTFPVIQLSVLFIILFFATDIFSAFFITILFFLFSVFFSILYEFWNNE